MQVEPNNAAFPRDKGGAGLTKREHMAIEFTKAIISNGAELSNQRICEEALLITDELIKQLNEK